MNFQTLLVSPPDEGPPPRRRGRKPATLDPALRELHLDVAEARLYRRNSPAQVARRYRVSIRTVQLYVRMAAGYDGERAEWLRSLARPRPHRLAD